MSDNIEKKTLKFIACKPFFEKSNCKNGEKCRFSHDSDVYENNKRLKKIPCKKFLDGKCTFGDMCLYSHDPTNISETPCPKFFGFNGNEKNTCDEKTCLFSHDLSQRKTFTEDSKVITAAGILLYKIIEDKKFFFLINEEEVFAEPGGKLNILDESPLCGAHREFEEETDTKCPFWDFENSSFYLPKAKYIIFVKKVSQDFVIESPKGKFIPIENLSLHPRSKEFIQTF